MTNAKDDYWDFYFCQIDDKPHSAMVNMSLRDHAPLDSLGVFQALEVSLKYPNLENGMTTQAEFQKLSDLEDLIFDNTNSSLCYVARQTGDGKRKFYFYSRKKDDLDPLSARIGSGFPDYETHQFSFDDLRWQTYFEDLYPNAIAMNEISNRHVMDRLEQNGDNLDLPRQIDHSVIFQDKQQAKKFASVVKDKGFSVQVTRRGIVKRSYDLLVQRDDAPRLLDPITLELERLAEALNGSYDGWGCLAVVGSSDQSEP